jgi:hypothetical protein
MHSAGSPPVSSAATRVSFLAFSSAFTILALADGGAHDIP